MKPSLLQYNTNVNFIERQLHLYIGNIAGFKISTSKLFFVIVYFENSVI